MAFTPGQKLPAAQLNAAFGAKADQTALNGVAVTAASAKAVTDTIFSGTWTPTITPVTNIDATTPFICQYARIGNVVTFSGQVNVDPTAASVTEFGMSLPIASNFSATRQAAGTYSSNSSTLKDGGCIFADATNDRLTFRHVAGGTANLSFFFSGSYLIV